MVFNKKYFLVMLALLTTQVILGIKVAHAICDEEAQTYCTETIRHQLAWQKQTRE